MGDPLEELLLGSEVVHDQAGVHPGRARQVFRIRDGKIVLFRDYFNVPGLPDLLAG